MCYNVELSSNQSNWIHPKTGIRLDQRTLLIIYIRAMHGKLYMQGHVMQCTAKYIMYK